MGVTMAVVVVVIVVSVICVLLRFICAASAAGVTAITGGAASWGKGCPRLWDAMSVVAAFTVKIE